VRKLNKIILVGAGRIGTIVAERLITHKKQNFLEKFIGIRQKAAQQFVIVETDEKKAKIASEKFPDATVYNVDITEEGFLEEENLQSFDLAITATHNHDQNLITAAYLKSMGIERTVCLVANESYSVIGRQLEIDVSVPIKDTIIDTIMTHLRGKDVRSIHNVSDGDLEIAEVEITEDAPVAGKALKDVAVPGKFLILLVKESSAAEYTVPNGNTVLNPHDHVVLISVQTESIRILEMFGVNA
jgi:trk system potassium uptake protein TrkA